MRRIRQDASRVTKHPSLDHSNCTEYGYRPLQVRPVDRLPSRAKQVEAMPRYFFHLVDGKHAAADKYGKELDSLYEAHLHALRMFGLSQRNPLVLTKNAFDERTGSR